VALLLSLNIAMHVLIGQMTYYSDGVMERVYANRLSWQHVTPCQECIGYAALIDREHIGKRVWIQRRGHAAEGPFLVVDCAAKQDVALINQRRRVVEVDYETAMRWHMRAPLDGVRVLFSAPTTARLTCPTKPGYACPL